MARFAPQPRRDGGFTLVEVLVVLIIVGLVSTLLVEAFFQVEGLRSRLVERMTRAEVRAEAGAWFRESVGAIHAHRVPEFPPFAGDETQFRAVTHAPLAAPAGQAVVVTWRLRALDDGRTVLEYQERGSAPWTVLTVAQPDDPQPRFAYLADDGTLSPIWPATQVPQGLRAADLLERPELIQREGRVPAGVVLAWQHRGRDRVWTVRIDGRKLPRPELNIL